MIAVADARARSLQALSKSLAHTVREHYVSDMKPKQERK